MIHNAILLSEGTTEEKNELIRQLREETYTSLRPTVREQVEYESRMWAGSVCAKKDEIRILYPYIPL